MGQTLAHGVYLPDEGERNCYSGLAANWSILDGAVGTIAEHTSALSEKAPLVHTHTVSQITDFPAYGNAAGTICEGNDSRLSDARTPLAHTHTKSDVTDLFNSANTWTGSNQFNTSVKFSGQTGINWARGGTTGTLPSTVLYYGFQNALDSNDNTFDRIRSYVSTTGTNLREHIKYAWNDLTKYATINFWINADGSDSEYKLSVKRVIPGSSNETDLGDSTHKWKTLNGINPGALSLPKIVTKNTANIASAIVGADGETQYLDGTDNNYTAALDGWISMCISGFTQSNELWITVYDQQNETWGTSAESSTSARNNLFIIFPIRANQKMRIRMRCNSVVYARFYPCEGNV